MAWTDRRPRRRLGPDSRRAAILEVAAAALAARLYAEVTISSITAEVYSSNALVYRYFVDKEDFYAEAVWMAIADLLTKQAEALDALPDGVLMRDHIRAATTVYLNYIAMYPDAWATPMCRPGGEPAAVAELRARTRCDYAKRLQDLLVSSTQACHGYVLWGCLGFIDVATLRWVGKGCPEEDRRVLIGAALGALEGALGDWAA